MTQESLLPPVSSDPRYESYLERAKPLMPNTYIRKFVAKDFQRMVRAAWASVDEVVTAVSGTELIQVHSPLGKCVCVTCGAVCKWEGSYNAIDAGHFVDSREASIVFEETNVAPQCKSCNGKKGRGGNPQAYWLWMDHTYGREEIERLMRLKETTRRFTIEELVVRRLGYKDRLAEYVSKLS